LACLVNLIWTYPGTTQDTQVRAGWRHGKLEQTSSQQVITMLRAACTTIGSACLGFEPIKISTHSLCLGAAMEMYLIWVPVYTIMLIGRWSSNAFLQYICTQVKQFSKHIAKQMLTHRLFCTIPDIAPCVVSNNEPWQRSHFNNAKTRRNIGRDMLQRV
jgi:hypothetical protein